MLCSLPIRYKKDDLLQAKKALLEFTQLDKQPTEELAKVRFPLS
jgi:hypothetical protein